MGDVCVVVVVCLLAAWGWLEGMREVADST